MARRRQRRRAKQADSEFEPIYREHVAADLDQLRLVRDRLAEQSPDDDPKLAALADVLRQTPGKVCVFATYGETISYLDEHLDSALGEIRERVVIIGGDTDPDERTRRLARFCPDTVVEPGYVPPGGEVDLLLSTDVVSEGQNLQQAGSGDLLRHALESAAGRAAQRPRDPAAVPAR